MEKEKMSTGLRGLLGFVSTLLCLMLTVSAIAAIAIADMQIITNKDNLQKIISQTVFTSSVPHRAVPKLAASAALASPAGRAAENPIQDAIVDALYDLVVGQAGSSTSITREQIRELLENPSISEFLSGKVASVISDVYIGQATTMLTQDEVEALLQENADFIGDTLHTTMDEEKIGFVSTYVDQLDIMGTVTEEVNSALGIDSGSPTTVPGVNPDNPTAAALNALRTYTSAKALAIAIIVCVALTALLFLSNWRKPFAAMVWIGAALLTASLPYLATTVLAAAAPGLLSGLSGWLGIAGRIAQVAMQTVLPLSLGVLCFGIALLVCGIVLGKRVKKNA